MNGLKKTLFHLMKGSYKRLTVKRKRTKLWSKDLTFSFLTRYRNASMGNNKRVGENIQLCQWRSKYHNQVKMMQHQLCSYF